MLLTALSLETTCVIKPFSRLETATFFLVTVYQSIRFMTCHAIFTPRHVATGCHERMEGRSEPAKPRRIGRSDRPSSCFGGSCGFAGTTRHRRPQEVACPTRQAK